MKKFALMMLAGAAMTSAALADVSRDEVRAIVNEALADAQTRSSLLQGGGAAGYDKGFYIASPNGDWKMNINGALQFRWQLTFRDDQDIVPGTTTDDLANGFQIRRAYLNFNGTLVNPNLGYSIRLVTDGVNNNFTDFDDMYMWYNYGNGWKIKGGTFKSAFLKENLNSDTTTMAAERGIVNSGFTPGRTQGLSAMWDGGDWRGTVEFTDGFNGDGTAFNSTGDAEMAFTGRLEWLFAGKWEALRDYTSKIGDANSGYVGAALHWEDSSNFIGATNDNRFFGWTVDAQWEGNGWGLFGAVVGAHNDPDVGANTSDYGVTAQASYRWDEAPEVFVKYDGIFADDARGFTQDDMHFVTVGFNNYFAGNNAKFTLDAVIALSETGPAAGGAGLHNTGFVPGNGNTIGANNGLLGSSSSGEIAVRAQWQIMF